MSHSADLPGGLRPDPTTRARELKLEADAFLETTRVLPALRRFGLVEFLGSYRLGVMNRKDIDLDLVVPRPSFAVLADVMGALREAGFTRFWVFDNLDQACSSDPSHIICEAVHAFWDDRVPFDDQWTLGVTICSPDVVKVSLAETLRIEEALNRSDGLKSIIINLKFALAEKYGERRIPGIRVYRAVIDHSAQTAEEVERLEASGILANS